MTTSEDMKRQWDGLESTDAAKYFIEATESARRMGNLYRPEPRKYNALHAAFLLIPIGMLAWFGIVYAVTYVWVKQ